MSGRISIEIDADTVKYISKITRLAQANQQAVDSLRGGSQELREQGTLADSLSGHFGGMVGKVASVTAALAAAAAAMRHFREEQRQALETGQTAELAMGQLAQVAMVNGVPDLGQLRQLQAQARTMAHDTGMELGQAARTVFALTSAGINTDENRTLVGGLAGIAGGDATPLAGGAGRIQAAFGQAEAGSIRAVLNKMLAASAISQAEVQEFAPAATLAANVAKTIGGSDEELLGLLAIMSRELKSVDLAGTRLSALADVIGVKGHGGQGIMAGVLKVAGDVRGASPAQLESYFGRKEARQAYLSLVDPEKRGDYLDAIASVDAAGASTATGPGQTDVVSSAIAINQASNPYWFQRREQRRLELAREGALGEGAADRDIARSARARRRIESGQGWLRRWVGSVADAADEAVGDMLPGENAIEVEGRFRRKTSRDREDSDPSSLQGRMLEALQASRRALERLQSQSATGSRLDMDR